MYIPNDDTQSDPNCASKLLVETLKHNEATNQNLLKSPNLLSQRIRKGYYKTMGTCVKNYLKCKIFLPP